VVDTNSSSEPVTRDQ